MDGKDRYDKHHYATQDSGIQRLNNALSTALLTATNITANLAPLLLATFVAMAIVVGSVSALAGESAAELLEKGIYTEETVGDLPAAIKIYQRVVENAEANRPHVAQAQFRLGMCHLKSKDEGAAEAAFAALIRDFPEQAEMVAQAEEKLASIQPALAPAPWRDGELLEYRISLPTGRTIGAMFLQAEATVVDGVDAWQLELRKLFTTGGNNYGVSRILVDRDTLRPISSTFRHGLLGKADAAYTAAGIDITGGATDTHLATQQAVYDNEQSLHLVRALPLALGYSTKIKFLPTWAPQVIEVGIAVKGKESCQVPAGEFDCYAVALDLGHVVAGQEQTLWYSTGAEHYPVKIMAGGVIFELVNIGQQEPGIDVTYTVEGFGLSGTLPSGWQAYEGEVPGRVNKAFVRLLDPDALTVSAIEIDRCPGGECPALQRTAERELAGAEQRFDSYQLRQESWRERTLDGRAAISFAGDYLLDGKPWVQYRIYTITDTLRLEIIFRTPAAHYAELEPVLDALLENIRAK